MRLFQKQTEPEKKEMIFEVLAPLAENGEVLRWRCEGRWADGRAC